MSIREWIQERADRVPINLAAAFLRQWLSGFGNDARAVTPEALEAAAQRGEQPVLEALADLPQRELAALRASFGAMAGRMTKDDYLKILQVLEWDHRQHVQVITRHMEWYGAQLDEARRWLSGGSKP